MLGGRPGEIRREKKHLSDERVASIIVDYLVVRREEKKPGCTAYDITKKAPKLTTTQRQQRIDAILGILERQGLVKCEAYERARYYSITDRGMEWYKTIVKQFYEVLGPLSQKTE